LRCIIAIIEGGQSSMKLEPGGETDVAFEKDACEAVVDPATPEVASGRG
jgi:hypothetical protein